jgi:predicted phage terminase large subunit-like protein
MESPKPPSASSIPDWLPTSITQYPKLLNSLLTLSEPAQIGHLRNLCRTDLYFLLRYACERKDLEHPWLFERCREVQGEPDGRLDLWARYHYKSSIGTFGLTLQDILNDPEETIGIFSHTRPIAKGFLRQLKRELESNDRLKRWFPDILWADPQKEAPKWSEDDGIVVKRRGNPKESTVEAWGVVDGQPTSKHFGKLIYDDVVTRESVSTPDMIAKTTDALSLSYALGKPGGCRRFYGTRYHFNDTYKAVLDRGTAKPRTRHITADGTETGEPVLITKVQLEELRRDMGPYIFAAQMLLNPAADSLQGFKREWMRHYQSTPLEAGGGTNKYLLVDGANEKRKDNDYTSMWVIGLASDSNYYVLDMLRDRLNLTERADAVFRLHRRWKPRQVRYEEYGMMADVQHIKDRQNRENYRFEIVKVGGSTPKNDRIKRLVPIFEQGRFYFPQTLHYVDYEKKPRDLVHDFIEEEYAAFPVGLHDDLLDSLARIAEPSDVRRPELSLVWPTQPVEEVRERYKSKSSERSSSWAA